MKTLLQEAPVGDGGVFGKGWLQPTRVQALEVPSSFAS